MEELQKTGCTHKLVAIYWLDADTSAGWTIYEKTPSPVYLISYGLVAGEDEHCITLSFTHNSDSDEYLSTHSIPKSMIKKIVEIDTSAHCSDE